MRTRVGGPEPEDSEPEELPFWLAAGFRAEDAEIWRRWRFGLAQAEAWTAAGVADGLQAAQWSTAGVAPDTVEAWRDAAIEATEAVRWHEFGYELRGVRGFKKRGLGPDQVFAQSHGSGRAPRVSMSQSSFGSAVGISGFGPGVQLFRQAGVDARVMHGYVQCQWVDQDAVAWAVHGIEVHDAYTWHELGLAPPEAARLAIKGRTPGDIVREWWTAGIPFGEVADWIGAGLSSTEAVEQRSRGITSEQAAALRALRREEDPPERSGPMRGAFMARHGPPGSEHLGPPPEDEEEARARITEAFARMLTRDQESNAIAAVEGGSNLGECLIEAARRHGIEEDAEVGSATTVTVELVHFVNDHEARVSFSVIIRGSRNIHLPDRPGKAVLVAGEWKVTRDTFCEFMQMAGVQCPPRHDV